MTTPPNQIELVKVSPTKITFIGAGGYIIPADPMSRVGELTAFWSHEANTGTVVLAGSPLEGLSFDPNTTSWSPVGETKPGDQLFMVRGPNAAPIFVALSQGATLEMPLAAVIPIDDDTPDRLHALDRFWRAVNGKRPISDNRVTAQQRRRMRHMLQASDGHLSGFSYREIANAIFGNVRVASDPWKTSALRDTTIRLVRDGQEMIAGGYRNLLRRHRTS